MTCCPPDSIPFLEEDPNYVPKGDMIDYDGVHAYCIGNGSKCLIFIHDIFGLNSGLNKQHCDTLAEYLPDYIVVAPDFFPNGTILEDQARGGNRDAYVIRHGWDHSSGGIFNKTTQFFIQQRNVQSFALLGFCWGSYIGFKACGEAVHKDRIFCNLSCHPSVVTVGGRFNERDTDIVELVNCPQFVASTKGEPASWKPGGEIEAQLQRKPFAASNEFYVYEEEVHGFVTRGDLKNVTTNHAILDCLNKILSFLRKFHA